MSEKPYKAKDDSEITVHGTTWQVIRQQAELKLSAGKYQCLLCDETVSADKICLHIITGERDGYVCRRCWMKTFEAEMAKELEGRKDVIVRDQ